MKTGLQLPAGVDNRFWDRLHPEQFATFLPQSAGCTKSGKFSFSISFIIVLKTLKYQQG
jgi:hypothetical protein